MNLNEKQTCLSLYHCTLEGLKASASLFLSDSNTHELTYTFAPYTHTHTEDMTEKHTDKHTDTLPPAVFTVS